MMLKANTCNTDTLEKNNHTVLEDFPLFSTHCLSAVLQQWLRSQLRQWIICLEDTEELQSINNKEKTVLEDDSYLDCIALRSLVEADYTVLHPRKLNHILQFVM
jgi:hypothetical protein